MIYEVLVESGFKARHGILLPNGTVEPTHSHDWHVTVRFMGPQLDECGLLVDFEAVKSDLDEVLAQLEGTDLNECPALEGLNPTAELVSKFIFEGMLQRCGGDERLYGIKVTEAPGCAAMYRRAGETGPHETSSFDDDKGGT